MKDQALSRILIIFGAVSFFFYATQASIAKGPVNGSVDPSLSLIWSLILPPSVLSPGDFPPLSCRFFFIFSGNERTETRSGRRRRRPRKPRKRKKSAAGRRGKRRMGKGMGVTRCALGWTCACLLRLLSCFVVFFREGVECELLRSSQQPPPPKLRCGGDNASLLCWTMASHTRIIFDDFLS